MKVRTHFLTIAAGAAFALGALSVPATASALTWETAITPQTSVSGSAQAADRTADWAKQVAAMEQLSGVRHGSDGPFGFLEEAKSLRGYPTAGQVAAR